MTVIKKNGKFYREIDVNELTKEELIDLVKEESLTWAWDCVKKSWDTPKTIWAPWFITDNRWKPLYYNSCAGC